MGEKNLSGAVATEEGNAPDLETEEESYGQLMERAGRILRQGVPAVATALLNAAEKGGVTHIKLVLDLVGIEGRVCDERDSSEGEDAGADLDGAMGAGALSLPLLPGRNAFEKRGGWRGD